MCGKCGFEEPVRVITGTQMLLNMAAMAAVGIVVALLTNLSGLATLEAADLWRPDRRDRGGQLHNGITKADR
jgi:hypothetical protein